MELLIGAVVYLLLRTLIGGSSLWFAGKLTATDCYYLEMLLVVALTALVELPFVIFSEFFTGGVLGFMGWLIPVAFFCVILKKVTQARFIPDLIVMLLIYNLIGIFVSFGIS